MSDIVTVLGSFRTETVINKSKFIATCFGVANEDEAKAFIEKTCKEFSDATHNCYAFVADELGNLMRFSDDGEPQGTAGMPILEVIRSKGLTKTLVVVTRYFGGIKLGAGGLVRAYSGAAADVLSAAKIVVFKAAVEIELSLSYSDYKLFNGFISGKSAVVLKTDYAEGVKVTLVIPQEEYSDIIALAKEYFLGRERIEEKNRYHYPF